MENVWQNQLSVLGWWTNFGLFFITQISAEASREEMERRLDKHMNKQNTQLNELMEKLEAQVSFLFCTHWQLKAKYKYEIRESNFIPQIHFK